MHDNLGGTGGKNRIFFPAGFLKGFFKAKLFLTLAYDNGIL